MLEPEFDRLNDLLWEIERRPHDADHGPLMGCIRHVNHTLRKLSRHVEKLERETIALQVQLDVLALEAHILDEFIEIEDEEVP